MKIADLPLPKKIVKALIASEPFDTLNPPQEATVEAGLFDQKNFLIAIPTASGKTFIAELSALQHVVQFHKKVIYLTPLKALALEKYHDFKRFASLGVKVGITVSDFDSADSHLFDTFDIIISTNEKIDSLLRHNKKFMQQNISLLVIDECHLIDEASRGPTLETLIVKIRRINPSIQLLALSATVHNSDELAKWLNATLIESNWRSVPVEEYFCNQEGLIRHRSSQTTRQIPQEHMLEILVAETLRDDGQVLIFANSRKRAQSIAISLQTTTKSFLTKEQIRAIKTTLSATTTDALTDKTSDSLTHLLQHGIGFHHAGLTNQQRSNVESLFKQHTIKVIVATPTLAAGINLPARRVIIPSIWRFSTMSSTMVPIKVMEYEQMRGRSGRPRYDSFGESFVLSSSERDEEVVLNTFFSATSSEDIESKLSARPILRIHLLGALATGIVSTYEDLKTFLEETFFGFQYNDFSLLEGNLQAVITDLESFGFIKSKSERIIVTRLGRRVSQLYIDPVSANIIIKGAIKSLSSPQLNPLMFIHLFCLVPDIRRIRLRKTDWGTINDSYEASKEHLLSDPQVIWNFKYENDVEAFKTALILLDWIEEQPLQTIVEAYDVQLGDFQSLLDNIKWVCYSAKELTKELVKILEEQDLTDFIYVESLSSFSVQDLKYLKNYITGLEIRLTEGIKEDIVAIINLKGLGRVKARTLIKNGIDTLDKLKNTSVDKLLTLNGFGSILVKSLKEQLGESIVIDTEDEQRENNFKTKTRKIKITKKTSSLADFLKD